MDQSEKVKSVRDLYRSHENYLAAKSGPPISVNFDDLMSQVLTPGPSYMTFLDSPTLIYDHVSPQFHKMFGFELEGESIEIIFSIFHPEDIPYVLKCENKVAEFIKSLPSPDKVLNYKFSYCIRERYKNGTYKLFMMQNIAIATTDDGALLRVFGVHSDISHITSINNHRLSCIGLNGEESFYFDLLAESDEALSEVRSKDVLTDREKGVVRLFAEGFTSQEIANKIFIADQTVIAHKKNAMKKLDCKNVVQLVSVCLRMGFI
jgi:DNA-binding CsgD family transcriptional regulator